MFKKVHVPISSTDEFLVLSSYVLAYELKIHAPNIAINLFGVVYVCLCMFYLHVSLGLIQMNE